LPYQSGYARFNPTLPGLASQIGVSGRDFGLGGLQWSKVRKGRGQTGWAPAGIRPKTDRKNKTFLFFFEIFPQFANLFGYNSNLNFELLLLAK
jgi:hypothetical protein